MNAITTNGPLENLEQWDDFVKERYDPNRTTEQFRSYDDQTPPVVREFYRLNHATRRAISCSLSTSSTRV